MTRHERLRFPVVASTDRRVLPGALARGKGDSGRPLDAWQGLPNNLRLTWLALFRSGFILILALGGLIPFFPNRRQETRIPKDKLGRIAA